MKKIIVSMGIGVLKIPNSGGRDCKFLSAESERGPVQLYWQFTLLLFLNIGIANAFSQEISISNLRFNILYLGIDNPLEAVVENYPCKSILLTTDNGNISKDSKCYYRIAPNNIGQAVINIYTINNGDTLKIGKKIFRVKNIPDPVAKIGGIDKGIISKDLLRIQYGIILGLSVNLDIDVKFIVEGYSVVIIRNNQALFIKDVIGGEFSDDIKKEFSILEVGDLLLFYNIISRYPDGIKRKINAVELTVGK